MGKNKEIQQGKFYHIKYTDNLSKDIIESTKVLQVGRYYRFKNGREFQVTGKAYFKYTYEDIDNVRVMMEDYDIGTVQHNLCKRMYKAFQQKTPAVRFSDEEREILSYIYYENTHIRESDKRTLEKILNIKKGKD